jgi:hypothetical protein
MHQRPNKFYVALLREILYIDAYENIEMPNKSNL